MEQPKKVYIKITDPNRDNFLFYTATILNDDGGFLTIKDRDGFVLTINKRFIFSIQDSEVRR